jgi:serine/threonine protein phosphatase PrpC
VAKAPLSQELLERAFAQVDALLSGSGINTIDSGSTALLCHIGPRSITTAWVGDSRAVLGRRTRQPPPLSSRSSGSSGWEVLPLSDDHKPERADEQVRCGWVRVRSVCAHSG